MPTTRTWARSTPNSSRTAAADDSAPATFLAPSSTTSGRWRTTSSRPGELTDAAAAATNVGLERLAEKRLRPRQGGHEIVGLVAAVEGEVNAFVAGARGAQVDQPASHCHHIGLDGEVPAGQPQSLGAFGGEDVVELGTRSPRAPGSPRA